MTSLMRRAAVTAAVVGAAVATPVVTAGTALAANAPSCVFITAEPVGWVTQTYHLHNSCKTTYKVQAWFTGGASSPCLTLKPNTMSAGFKIFREYDFRFIEKGCARP
ncbi:hypothetical protein [Allokutzneria oryzae]|uniref:Secreted protein n=1 Tax=Allokutzneria oryzae TaxID=1378989 RepID=A0ABV6A7L7_9PSEU